MKAVDFAVQRRRNSAGAVDAQSGAQHALGLCSAPQGRAQLSILLAAALFGCHAFFSAPADTVEVADLALQLRVNPNTAHVADLELLPGIGPVLANRLVERRTQPPAAPAYRDMEDIDNVAGFGPVRIEQLRPFLRFDGGNSPASTRTAPAEAREP
jgi:DNA uptake protein ComE-like DNA-binding protein